ncbi:alpha/beta hydrolase [Paenisporosarcina antarctica]|uniref:Esterase family protein n=1 Tax=Paenisporosarcina antarctica TaxID=417367 RepID=A0A4P6ZYD2_9BACL|nr:alpha/beta hydrolase-fold protein [Paenisporosarcina antarctica]QBP41680.1 esterase family protein [Paenisporosarcina antarctica]
MSKGTIQDVTLFSDALQEDMQLLIYLPTNYSPLYKYTVLIASDGKDYFQLGRISRVTDELLENKEIENIIIVGIPYKSVEDRNKKYHPSGEQHDAYLRFLAHELVPYLDKEYPTYQIGMGRALIGDSLAATVSLLAAVKYPNIFGKVILHSPMVNTDVLSKVENIRTPHSLSVYHIIGTGEDKVKLSNGKIENFLKPNRDLNSLMQEKGFLVFYDEFIGDHTWKHWQPDIKRSIKMNFSL